MGYHLREEAAAQPRAEMRETGRVLTGFESVGSGYRYYSSELGRWINRDPINEFAFNIIYPALPFPSHRFYSVLTVDYLFLGNDPLIGAEFLGLAHIMNRSGAPLLVLVKVHLSPQCLRWFRDNGHGLHRGIPGVPWVLPNNISTRDLTIIRDADAYWASHPPGTGGIARKTGGTRWRTYEIDMTNISTAGRDVGTFRAEFYGGGHSLQQQVNSLFDVTYRDIITRGLARKCCTEDDMMNLESAIDRGRYALSTFPSAE